MLGENIQKALQEDVRILNEFITKTSQKNSIFESIINHLPRIVYWLYLRDRKRMEFSNENVKHLTGYKAQDLRFREFCTVDPLMFPVDRKNVRKVAKKAFETGESIDMAYRIWHKNGSIRFLVSWVQLFFEEIGEPVYLDGTNFDITKTKLKEVELQEHEHDYRTLHDYAPIPAWEVDISGMKAYMEILEKNDIKRTQSDLTDIEDASASLFPYSSIAYSLLNSQGIMLKAYPA